MLVQRVGVTGCCHKMLASVINGFLGCHQMKRLVFKNNVELPYGSLLQLVVAIVFLPCFAESKKSLPLSVNQASLIKASGFDRFVFDVVFCELAKRSEGNADAMDAGAEV